MRFTTFDDGRGARAGVLFGPGDERVLDLAHEALRARLAGSTPDVGRFVAEGLRTVADRIASASYPQAAVLERARVRILAPYRPRRIFGIAHNYACALAERGAAHPEKPVLFMKGGDTVIGPDEQVVLPAGIGGCTYEAELGVVIGRRADRVSVAEARRYVAGYVAFNDVSASQLIRSEGSFDRGKNLPTFGPLGPYLATADEIADPHALGVLLEVDGVTRQRGTTADLVFDVDELIAWLSADAPLEPGDLIATGTPAGVAPLQSPPTWLTPGAQMRVAVQGLGVLANPIVERGVWHG